MERLSQPFAFNLGKVITLVLLLSVNIIGSEIHDAAIAGDVEKVRLLLKKNPKSVNARNEDGETPLHMAWPSTQVIKLLLKTAPTSTPATRTARPL